MARQRSSGGGAKKKTTKHKKSKRQQQKTSSSRKRGDVLHILRNALRSVSTRRGMFALNPSGFNYPGNSLYPSVRPPAGGAPPTAPPAVNYTRGRGGPVGATQAAVGGVGGSRTEKIYQTLIAPERALDRQMASRPSWTPGISSGAAEISYTPLLTAEGMTTAPSIGGDPDNSRTAGAGIVGSAVTGGGYQNWTQTAPLNYMKLLPNITEEMALQEDPTKESTDYLPEQHKKKKKVWPGRIKTGLKIAGGLALAGSLIYGAYKGGEYLSAATNPTALAATMAQNQQISRMEAAREAERMKPAFDNLGVHFDDMSEVIRDDAKKLRKEKDSFHSLPRFESEFKIENEQDQMADDDFANEMSKRLGPNWKTDPDPNYRGKKPYTFDYQQGSLSGGTRFEDDEERKRKRKERRDRLL